jgi:hypothetical protein
MLRLRGSFTTACRLRKKGRIDATTGTMPDQEQFYNSMLKLLAVFQQLAGCTSWDALTLLLVDLLPVDLGIKSQHEGIQLVFLEVQADALQHPQVSLAGSLAKTTKLHRTCCSTTRLGTCTRKMIMSALPRMAPNSTEAPKYRTKLATATWLSALRRDLGSQKTRTRPRRWYSSFVIDTTST